MKNLIIVILVFSSFISAGYSFECYECGPAGNDQDYSVEQCEKDKKVVDCPPAGPSTNLTCFRFYGTTADGKEREQRGCTEKAVCESFKKVCEEGTDEQKKANNVKECQAACCVSDGDTPCNTDTSDSFKCYQCDNGDVDEDFTEADCEKVQTEKECGKGSKCFKIHGIISTDKKKEVRGCMTNTECLTFKRLCNEGTDEELKNFNIKSCEASCCETEGDTPCNGGFTVSINMFMIMLAVLCSLKLF